MKHDHAAFGASSSSAQSSLSSLSVRRAYAGDIGDRVRRFLPMVRRLAWHVHGAGSGEARQLPGIELEDLMQAGLVALTECAQRHQGPGEDGFAAYAKLRVRGAMVDLIRRAAPLSRGAVERRRLLRETEQRLCRDLGRDPTRGEVAAALGLSAADLASLSADNQPLRFEPIDEVYSDHNAAFADDRPDSHALLVGAESRHAVIAAIADLPERLQLVIQLYFVEELNLAEIAEVLSVSIPRIHQLKAQALAQLRKSLEGVAEVL